MVNKHLKSFGLIQGTSVITGFVLASLLSTFLLQSSVNGSHQSTLSQALAEEIAQQVNIKEAWLVGQLGKIASSSLATGAVTGSIADLSAAELTIAQVLDGTSGQVSVMQAVGVAKKPISTSGTAGTGPTVVSTLSNPNWTLQYTPLAAISENSPVSFLLYLLPGIALLLISLGGIAFGAIWTGTLIQQNLTIIESQIGRIADGNYDTKVSYTLPGFADQDRFADQDNKLKRLLTYIPTKAEDSKPAPLKKQTKTPEATVVDIEMSDDNLFEEVEELEIDDFDTEVEEANKTSTDYPSIKHIFRAYDIRGIVGESTSEDIARQIGLAVGSEAGDCGNGIAGSIAPELLDNLGCETVPLYCRVDDSFPNHHPDPTKPENLKDLIATVKPQDELP